ncbi:MAG: hypothetical protein ACREPY_18475, partial [Rhodanobacteraceae bacterium]
RCKVERFPPIPSTMGASAKRRTATHRHHHPLLAAPVTQPALVDPNRTVASDCFGDGQSSTSIRDLSDAHTVTPPDDLENWAVGPRGLFK